MLFDTNILLTYIKVIDHYSDFIQYAQLDVWYLQN